MSYVLQYTEKAASQLERLPAEFVGVVEANLAGLAATPASLSVPIASPPFPPRGQLFHFETTDSNAKRWFFTVIFCFLTGRDRASDPQFHLEGVDRGMRVCVPTPGE